MDVNWGFLGAGYVASRAMAPAVHNADGARLYSVASRDVARSESLEPSRIHQSYADLIDDDDVDAVYISLANHQHMEWVVRALKAGKHVLCEKPLGITASDVEHMHATATEMSRTLIEATWVRWHPRFQRFAYLASSGALGDVEHIESAFTSTAELSDNYRLHPEMGGGALLDVGCYQAHVWVAIFGQDVAVSVHDVTREIGNTGVDITTRAEVSLNSYATATQLSSFQLPPSQILTVQGTENTMHMLQGEAFTSWREQSSLRIGDMEETFEPVDAFVEMVRNVSASLKDESGWVFPHQETQRVAQIIDSISTHRTHSQAD